MKVVLGVPSGRTVVGEFYPNLLDWLHRPSEHQVMLTPRVNNRVDVGRSQIIQKWKAIAKKEAELDQELPALIQIDTDVGPLTNIDKILEFAHESFAVRHAALVLAPLNTPQRGKDGEILMVSVVRPEDPDLQGGDPEHVLAKGPISVLGASFGLVVFNPEWLLGLAPVATWDFIDGTSTPMYMAIGPTETEDAALIRRAREKGWKAIVDPRIEAKHWKMIPC